MTPHEVKFALDQKLLELARGGIVPMIVGLHSLVVENDTAFATFDIAPDPTGDGLLHFEFEIPALVSRADVREFGLWVATAHCGETVH